MGIQVKVTSLHIYHNNHLISHPSSQQTARYFYHTSDFQLQHTNIAQCCQVKRSHCDFKVIRDTATNATYIKHVTSVLITQVNLLTSVIISDESRVRERMDTGAPSPVYPADTFALRTSSPPSQASCHLSSDFFPSRHSLFAFSALLTIPEGRCTMKVGWGSRRPT